jgi:hypothetical protein
MAVPCCLEFLWSGVFEPRESETWTVGDCVSLRRRVGYGGNLTGENRDGTCRSRYIRLYRGMLRGREGLGLVGLGWGAPPTPMTRDQK